MSVRARYNNTAMMPWLVAALPVAIPGFLLWCIAMLPTVELGLGVALVSTFGLLSGAAELDRLYGRGGAAGPGWRWPLAFVLAWPVSCAWYLHAHSDGSPRAQRFSWVTSVAGCVLLWKGLISQ